MADHQQGGLIIYPSSSAPALLNETTNFHSSSTDRKTQIITTIGGSPTGNTALALFFHDGPEQPKSLQAFKDIPHLVNTLKSRSFLSLVESIPSALAQVANVRGAFATFSTSDITTKFVFAIKEECDVSYIIAAARSQIDAFAETRKPHAPALRTHSELRYRTVYQVRRVRDRQRISTPSLTLAGMMIPPPQPVWY
jgi:hypothetical protein